MRVKTFSGKSTDEVMARVRKELGPEALIIRTDKVTGTGVKITAAITEPEKPENATPKEHESKSRDKITAGNINTCDGGELTSLVFSQGMPFDLATRLQTAAMAFDTPDVQTALTCVFDSWFKFRPPVLQDGNNYLLVGPPGSGKTVGAAKLAVACLMQDKPVEVISLDHIKAGALHQLSIYGKAMNIKIMSARSPGALTAKLSNASNYDPVRIIDSWGVNPYDPSALADLAQYTGIKSLIPILMLPSGLSPDEATEVVEIFSGLGVSRVVASKVDCARRHGGLIAALYRTRMSLAAISGSPFIGDCFEKATPQILAKLLKPVSTGHTQTIRKVV